MSAVLHIIPLGGDDEPDEHDDVEHDGDDKQDGEGENKHLEDAFHAAKEDDKDGFIAAMRAAIKSCIADYEGSESEESEGMGDHNDEKEEY